MLLRQYALPLASSFGACITEYGVHASHSLAQKRRISRITRRASDSLSQSQTSISLATLLRDTVQRNHLGLPGRIYDIQSHAVDRTSSRIARYAQSGTTPPFHTVVYPRASYYSVLYCTFTSYLTCVAIAPLHNLISSLTVSRDCQFVIRTLPARLALLALLPVSQDTTRSLTILKLTHPLRK